MKNGLLSGALPGVLPGILIMALAAVLAGCAQASWTEARGNGALSQEDNGAAKPTPLNPADPPTFPPEPVKFSDCKTQALSVSVGIGTTDDNVKDALSLTARYPRFNAVKTKRSPAMASFTLVPTDRKHHSCRNETCAESAGWTAIQRNLVTIDRVTVGCLTMPKAID